MVRDRVSRQWPCMTSPIFQARVRRRTAAKSLVSVIKPDVAPGEGDQRLPRRSANTAPVRWRTGPRTRRQKRLQRGWTRPGGAAIVVPGHRARSCPRSRPRGCGRLLALGGSFGNCGVGNPDRRFLSISPIRRTLRRRLSGLLKTSSNHRHRAERVTTSLEWESRSIAAYHAAWSVGNSAWGPSPRGHGFTRRGRR